MEVKELIVMESLIRRALDSGEPLEIIYQSASGNLTQRVIFVKDVNGKRIRAYCTLRKQTRFFNMDHILSGALSKKRWGRSG